jgi:solute carrier family 7 (L-type amino acid transporter), member 9/15
LGTLIPKSGAEYAYFLDGFGPLHRFWGPLPAFLYSWITVLLLRPMSYAIGCLSFANYAIVPLIASLGLCTNPEEKTLLIQLTGVLCLCKF